MAADFDSMQKDCDALGGLFQAVIADLKGSPPVWEDFISKATKYNAVLRSTAAATGVFLDAFQKVADLANNSRGATREIGAALTRLCIRHRSLENKLKSLASAIVDQLVEPLQGKMDDWKKAAVTLDKDHNRDYKKAHQEIKKASQDLGKLRKRAGKGRADAQVKLDQVLSDVGGRYQKLELAEKAAVRLAMIEERNRFCFFFGCLKPVMDVEIGMLQEVTHFEEIIHILSNQTDDSSVFPAASEQVIIDLKGTESTWTFRTPPGSPVLGGLSQLGSRKSSMCSVNSSSSGSTRISLQSPSHNPSAPLLTPSVSVNNIQSRCSRQLSSVSSQDSGFVSHDIDHGSLLDNFPRNLVTATEIAETSTAGSTSSESVGASIGSWSGSSTELHQSSTSSGQLSCPPLVSGANFPSATNSASGLAADPMSFSAHDRPHAHTISASYDRIHTSRPVLTSQTFEPMSPSSLASSIAALRSRPLSSMVYAVPTAVPQRTADIYARPVLCGSRRGLVGAGAQPVVPPTAPADYAVCGLLRPTSTWTDEMTLASVEKDSEQSHLHRCASVPAQANEVVTESTDEVSATDDAESGRDLSFLLRHRRLMLNDDNYIMTNTASLCDSHKQLPSHDFESLMDTMRSKRSTVSEIGKSLTLPRNCLPFRLPEFQHRATSVIVDQPSGSGLLRSSITNNSNGNVSNTGRPKARPPPPARRHSVKAECLPVSEVAEPVSDNIPAAEEAPTSLVPDGNQEDEKSSAPQQHVPKQQAPPTDDDSDTFWLPPPPSSVTSCSVIVIDPDDTQQWQPNEIEPIPTAQQSVVPTLATVSSVPGESTGSGDSETVLHNAALDTSSDTALGQENKMTNDGGAGLPAANSGILETDIDSLETSSTQQITNNNNGGSGGMLDLIRQGVKLRKTLSNDRSAPRIN